MGQSTKLQVLVHIVTFSSAETIRPALDSVCQQNGFILGDNLEILVTDNASSDETLTILRSEYSQKVTIRANAVNLGFTGAHNQGAAYALKREAEFLFVLNPDVRLEPNCLRQLVECLRIDPRAGGATPKLYRSDEHLEPVQPLCFDSTGMFITPEVRHFDRGSNQLERLQYDEPQYVFGITGAAALFRRSFLLDAPLLPADSLRISESSQFLFDPLFFAYREDADLAWRGQWLGWKFRYEPLAIAYHKRKVLPEMRLELPPELNALSVKNRVLLLANNWNLSLLRATTACMLWRNILVLGGVWLRERSSWPALRSGFQLLPVARRTRQLLKCRRRVPGSYLARWFAFRPISEPALSHTPSQQPIRSITAIVVNFNSGNRLATCLKELHRVVLDSRNSLEMRVCIFDNASNDDSVERLTPLLSELPQFHLEKAERNFGFAGAINRAAILCPADAYLILNPDIEIGTEAVLALRDALDHQRNVAVVAPVLEDAQGEIQHGFVARDFPSIASTLAELFFFHRLWPQNPWTRRYHQTDDPFLVRYLEGASPGIHAPHDDPSKPYLVPQPPAACILVRHADFQSVSGFDEGFYPAWFEDVDFCRRLHSKQKFCALVSTARAKHEGGYSKKHLGPSRFAAIWYPNLHRYWEKHGTPWEKFILSICLPIALILRGLLAYLGLGLGEQASREERLAFAKSLFSLSLSYRHPH